MVRRASPHGHVAAVLGTLRDIGIDRLLGPCGHRCRDLVIAMIVARLIAPASKLATARMLDPLTAAFSLGGTLGLGIRVDEDELYVALDWLGERQEAVEKALARKHLRAGMLVLYDVSSSYLEGRSCELARLGSDRARRRESELPGSFLQFVCAAPRRFLRCAIRGSRRLRRRSAHASPRGIRQGTERFTLGHIVLIVDRRMIAPRVSTARSRPGQARLRSRPVSRPMQGLAQNRGLPRDLTLYDQREQVAAITSPFSRRAAHRLPRSRSLAREHRPQARPVGRGRRASPSSAAAGARHHPRAPLHGEGRDCTYKVPRPSSTAARRGRGSRPA